MSTKVFVGNLDFNTTDQVLKDAFAHCGPVKRGVIITRGRRPLGYGFVEFDSPEVALASVEKMNKVELLGRLIKVEVAKDHPKDFQWKNVNTEIGGGKETGPAPRRQKRRVNANDLVGEDDMPASNPAPIKASPEDAFAGDAPRSTPNTRRRRKTKKVRPVTEKILSKTTLFVANLPFSVDDEKLKSIFEGTNVKSARVVRTRNGRSRGYGFVEFEDEKDQITAMQSKNEVEVEGTHGLRKISVTISNSISPPEETNVTGTSLTTSNPEDSPNQAGHPPVPMGTGHQGHTPTGSTSPTHTGTGHQGYNPTGSTSPTHTGTVHQGNNAPPQLRTASGSATSTPSSAGHQAHAPGSTSPTHTGNVHQAHNAPPQGHTTTGPTSPTHTGTGHQGHNAPPQLHNTSGPSSPTPTSPVHQVQTTAPRSASPASTGPGHQGHPTSGYAPAPTSTGHQGHTPSGSTSPAPTGTGHQGHTPVTPSPAHTGTVHQGHTASGSTSPAPTSSGHPSSAPTGAGHQGHTASGSTSPAPTGTGHQGHTPSGSTSPAPTGSGHPSTAPTTTGHQGHTAPVSTSPVPTGTVHQGHTGSPATGTVHQGHTPTGSTSPAPTGTGHQAHAPNPNVPRNDSPQVRYGPGVTSPVPNVPRNASPQVRNDSPQVRYGPGPTSAVPNVPRNASPQVRNASPHVRSASATGSGQTSPPVTSGSGSGHPKK